MDGVHSAGATEHAALAAAAVPPRRRTYTAAERIFGSMRFGVVCLQMVEQLPKAPSSCASST